MAIGYKKRLLFLLVLVLVPYLALEAVVSAVGWFRWFGNSILILEDAKHTIQFDPVCGYCVGPTPVRSARITDGEIEFVGILRGNAQGFAGWQDVSPKRDSAYPKRIAVFGDSFTDGHFLGQSWPDRAQDLTRQRREPVQFLNFAQTGAGLANWWSIVTRLLEPRNYELDGIIFAVWETDLRRPFTMWNMPDKDEPGACMRFGRTTSWDPTTFPTTLDQARPFLKDEERYVLPREEFESALQGRWPASVPRHFQLVLATKVWHFFRTRLRLTPPAATPDDKQGRDRLTIDIHSYIARKKLPVLVVHIPMRENLYAQAGSRSVHFEEIKAFAQQLNAPLLDASDLFAGMSRREIAGHFLPHDGHWNQKGSDRFAEFVVQHLDQLSAPAASVTVGGAR